GIGRKPALERKMSQVLGQERVFPARVRITHDQRAEAFSFSLPFAGASTLSVFSDFVETVSAGCWLVRYFALSAFSISWAIWGLFFRKSFAFSRPWPSRSVL